MTTREIRHPDQPDGIDFDSYDLPTVPRAARRVRAFIAEWGDGLVDVAGLRPLYARDLEVVVRAAEEAEQLRTRQPEPDRLARAIADPGSVLPRREGETVARWSTRAVIAVLDANHRDPITVELPGVTR